jgi:hypothetical protein
MLGEKHRLSRRFTALRKRPELLRSNSKRSQTPFRESCASSWMSEAVGIVGHALCGLDEGTDRGDRKKSSRHLPAANCRGAVRCGTAR